jgi:hypothetical protein
MSSTGEGGFRAGALKNREQVPLLAYVAHNDKRKRCCRIWVHEPILLRTLSTAHSMRRASENCQRGGNAAEKGHDCASNVKRAVCARLRKHDLMGHEM